MLLREDDDDDDEGEGEEDEDEEDARAPRRPVPPSRTMEEPRPRREERAASYSSSLGEEQRSFWF